ncbi:serine/threonine-protein phosphatase 6 regulatory ankyrin repeat subunit A isoform X2 [Patella vulgata]|nr:serine/threonine-protein phosphatase 6 regulatory ankyrin repeat subunit A isoform X2 [Patella vulgata]XP_050405540.1 serine/threonine-protein phosphatase 6 regulatory ankyrin repeat subunit A isoform X2 [Patella vulgata]
MEKTPSAPPVPKVSKLIPNKYNQQPSKKGRRFLKELQFKLVGAIESHNLLEVNRLIKNGVDLDCIILIHKTPLIHALEKFPLQPTLAVTLMEAGANVEKPEVVARRRFPIHVAVMSGSLLLVNKLLDFKANIDGRDGSGMTPLHYACYYGFQDIASELLKRQPAHCIHYGDDTQRCAIHRAIEGKHFHVAEMLFKHGALVNSVDKSGWSPLFQCIVFNEVSSVKYLLNRGADVNLQDVNGNTPLHIACNPLARDHVRVILTTSVDYYKRTRRIPTAELQALFLSEQGGFLKAVQFLVNAGADVNINNKIDIRPIHNTRSAHIMTYLIACGSEIGVNTLTNLELSGETNLVESVRNSNSFSGQMTLLHKCRSVIRNCLSHTRDVYSSVNKLPLPQKLIEYINLVNYDS